jgi:EEF1A N-terminal glycine/lysine methyltransferase
MDLDVVEEGLSFLFEEPIFAFGNAGGFLNFDFKLPNTNTTKSIHLQLSNPSTQNTNLMAHYVWQASLVLVRLIQSSKIKVVEKTIIELGAGHGLVSITAGLFGAKHILCSDYPDDEIIDSMRKNLESALGKSNDHLITWKVIPHIWGHETISSLSKPSSGKDILILMADVLWIPNSHDDLLFDIVTILHTARNGKTVIAAGLHTGRQIVQQFFHLASSKYKCKYRKLGEVKVGLEHQNDDFKFERIGNYTLTEAEIEWEKSNPSERKKWILVYEMWI